MFIVIFVEALVALFVLIVGAFGLDDVFRRRRKPFRKPAAKGDD